MQSIIKKIVLVSLAIIPFIVLHVADGGSFDVLAWFSGSSLFFPFISGKNLLFRMLVEVAFAGWAVLALYDHQYRINVKKSPIIIAYGLFVLVLLLADLFGVSQEKSMWSNFERMEGFVGHIHLFVYFFVLTVMVRNLAEWKKMWKVFIAADVLVLVYALGQFFGAKGLFFSNTFPLFSAWFADRFAIHMSGNRLDATIGNSAYFGVFCLMYVFIATLLWYQTKWSKNSWLYPALIVLNTFGVLYSGTRGSMIGLLTGALVSIGVIVFRWNDSRREVLTIFGAGGVYVLYTLSALLFNNSLLKTFGAVSCLFAVILLLASVSVCVRTKDTLRRLGAGVFIAAIVLVGLFQAVKQSSFVKDSSVLARIATISATDITGASRLAMWKISYEAWKERPVLGYGQDNFSYVFARKFLPERMCNLEPWYDRSHNVFFDWLVAAGALGLLTYLSLYGVTLWFMWKKENDMTLSEKAILTGALVGYFIHNFFVFDNLTSYILFFALLAYVTVRTKSNRDTSHSRPLFDNDQMNLLVIPVIGIVLCVTLYTINIRPLIVNQLVIKAMSVRPNGNTAQAFADMVKVEQDAFVSAVEMNTLGSLEAREQFVQLALRISQNKVPESLPPQEKQLIVSAINNMLLAVRTQIVESYPTYKDDVRMLSIYAMFFNGIGDTASSKEVLAQALKLAPNKQLLRFDLIRALLVEKKVKEAYALAKETYDLSPTCHDADKWLLVSASYAGAYKEGSQYLVSKGSNPTIDQDVISGVVSSGQISVAIELLENLKKQNPQAATQIDNLIQQIRLAPKK